VRLSRTNISSGTTSHAVYVRARFGRCPLASSCWRSCRPRPSCAGIRTAESPRRAVRQAVLG